MRRLLLLATVPVLALTGVFLFLIFRTDEVQTVHEKKTSMGSISIPLPEGWQTGSEPGVTYAVKPPCASLSCAGIAIFDGNGLTGKWEKAVLSRYTCTGNKKEETGKVTQKSTPQFGPEGREIGTVHYTVPLCGTSNSEVLEIWETRLPTRIVVVPINGKYRLPDATHRLNRSEW